jgi:hypothetical protein
MSIVQQQRFPDFELYAVLFSSAGEKILRIPVADFLIFGQPAGIADKLSLGIVEWNRESAFQHSAVAVAEAEMPDRLIREFPIFQIRVIRFERFKLEVDGRVNQYPLIRCCWPFLIRSSTANLKDISDLERPLSQFVRMVGIESLHPAAEVQDIALGMAAEALPDAALKVHGE